MESSAQSSKAEPRRYSCPVPESAGKSPPFSHGDIVSALSSHPGGQVGQYLSGLFWKLGMQNTSLQRRGLGAGLWRTPISYT